MIIVGTDGHYKFIDSTTQLETSDHPVYQAQIEVALGRGAWIGAPLSGHTLPVREKQSPSRIREYEKQLNFYLEKYEPEIRREAIARASSTLSIVIGDN